MCPSVGNFIHTKRGVIYGFKERCKGRRFFNVFGVSHCFMLQEIFACVVRVQRVVGGTGTNVNLDGSVDWC
jgi:hypothetical protein